MTRIVPALLLALGALALPGCGVAPCDSARVCSLDHDGTLCDGSHFVPCDDGHRGQKVLCGVAKPAAICTTGGWTFQGN